MNTFRVATLMNVSAKHCRRPVSEAELHILKGRMYQGRLNKADRGELLTHPPLRSGVIARQ
jgi:hypothetical protein